MCEGPKPAKVAPDQESVAISPAPAPASIGKPVLTSALTVDGQTIDLGLVGRFETIASVKQLVAAKSGLNAGRQQVFVIDDTRDDSANLALKNFDTVQQATEYSAACANAGDEGGEAEDGNVHLQLAVMIENEADMAEFVADILQKELLQLGDGLDKPIGVAFVPTLPHLLLSAEMYGNTITVYNTSRAAASAVVCKAVGKGNGELEFNSLYGVCVTDCWSSGLCVVVSEVNNNRLQVLKLTMNPDGSSGRFEFVRFIAEGGTLACPRGIAARAEPLAHHVLVTDTNHECVREYDVNDGRLVASYGGGMTTDDGERDAPHKRGATSGAFSQPHDVCTMSDGGFAVTDQANNRVQVFDEKVRTRHRAWGIPGGFLAGV
jgi:hypothetical protein